MALKFSYVHLPQYPLEYSIETIQLADRLGYWAFYCVDETWHKDAWLLFAAAADKTSNIRMGPNVTHVILRDPALIVQALGTLDELTNGRTECVLSFGNLSLLEQHHTEWKGKRPLSRVKEATEVMRTMLKTGTIEEFDGEFFKYSGLSTAARPVQDPFPIKLGAMGGPRSFELAGAEFDGMHHAIGYSRENYEYVMEHTKKGAEKAGRNWEELDLGAWVAWITSKDSAAAKEVARIIVAFYIPSMPQSLVERHGIEYQSLQPLLDAFGRGDVAGAVELCTPELAEKLSIAGTPEECAEKVQRDILPTGINHIIACITDPHLVKVFTGQDVGGVPDAKGQLQLIHDEVFPLLGVAV